LLREGKALGVAVVAIGGITAANMDALVDAGASAVAVIADVFAHENAAAIARAASAIARRFAAGPQRHRPSP
jgi:thiamine monophosphate synthase